MCGITGYFGFNDFRLLKKMTNTLKHRGPNDEGFLIEDDVGLGNRRLSIIDVKGGKQPIHNETKTIWITYNGEIYNYQELRAELLRLRHKFQTNSDTETIVHAYEQWGTNCLKKLNGMFAFAIWDSWKKILFIARDRLGIKPLYYHEGNGGFIFASEIKALLQNKRIERIPNEKVIYQFLIDGVHDHTEETFFLGIKRLMPAHYMIVSKKGIKIGKYWELKINRKLIDSKSDEQRAKEFYNMFEDSIRRHLISEVAVGTCLSGGLDSSSIVCLVNEFLKKQKSMKQILGKRQKVFSAVYSNPEIDEKQYINQVVKFTGVEKNFAYPNERVLWKELKRFVYYQEEPVASTSPFAQWSVMKLASRKVTVLLDGQGGDEIFAGYIPYFLVFFRDLMKRKEYFLLAKEFLMSLDLTSPLMEKYLVRGKKEAFAKSLLNENFVRRNEKAREKKWESNDLSEKLYLDTTKFSLPKLLRYEDKNSMAFSIEARVPYLDYRIVEYAFSLPINQKIRNGWTKFVVRNALKERIPEKIRLRRSKLGFPTPEANWLRKLSPVMGKIFSSNNSKRKEYLDFEAIKSSFEDFAKGKLNDEYSDIFWRILNLELWFRTFID